MPEEPNSRGLAWLIAAKMACCGGLLLVAGGALSLGAVVRWLLDGGIAWLAGAALAVPAAYLWWRYRAGRPAREQGKRTNAPRGAA